MSDRTPKRSNASSQRPVRASEIARTQRTAPGTDAGAARVTTKRVSHQEREATYQRWLMIGLSVAAALLLLILGAGGIFEYRIKPNQVLATVNGYEIKRKDYWSYQTVQLANQARAYKEYATKVTGDQQTQLLTYAAQIEKEEGNVWGSSDVSDATIKQMVEDQLYLKAAEEKGVDLSDQRIHDYALSSFAPFDNPIVHAAPTPTMIPQRSAWATQTVEAQATLQASQLATPAAGASPVASPGASPVAATPASTATATPTTAMVRTTAQSDYDSFVKDVLPDAHMSESDYLAKVAKPLVARDAINSEIVSGVSQTAPQVEVEHILVTTEDLAKQTYSRLQNGENFENVAMSTSTDTSTAPTGGKLGWVTNGELVPELNDAAFKLQPGQMSEPIKTGYGWHIVKVINRDDNRALTESQYNDAIAKAKSDWLKAQVDQRGVSSDHYKDAETPTPETFVAPADAPTPKVATPVAAPDLSGTPVAGPKMPTSSPSASPDATP